MHQNKNLLEGNFLKKNVSDEINNFIRGFLGLSSLIYFHNYVEVWTESLRNFKEHLHMFISRE